MDIKWLVVLSVVMSLTLSFLAEWRRSYENTNFLKFVGAQENKTVSFWSKSFRILLMSAAVFSLAEFLVGRYSLSLEKLLVGVIMAIVGLALKYWALASTGRYWSHRCYVVIGAGLQQLGPYRWLDHPEWLARLLEVFGIWFCLQNPVLGAFFLFLAIAAAWHSARIEKEFLRKCRMQEDFDESQLLDQSEGAFG